jgi:hypothetical protein
MIHGTPRHRRKAFRVYLESKEYDLLGGNNKSRALGFILKIGPFSTTLPVGFLFIK